MENSLYFLYVRIPSAGSYEEGIAAKLIVIDKI